MHFCFTVWIWLFYVFTPWFCVCVVTVNAVYTFLFYVTSPEPFLSRTLKWHLIIAFAKRFTTTSVNKGQIYFWKNYFLPNEGLDIHKILDINTHYDTDISLCKLFFQCKLTHIYGNTASPSNTLLRGYESPLFTKFRYCRISRMIQSFKLSLLGDSKTWGYKIVMLF